MPRIPAYRRDAGFTLVELVSVIAVTGILTATALPRLTAITGEARYATLMAAGGALMSVAVTANGQFRINGTATQAFEDVTVPLVNGYPGAVAATAEAAGLDGRFTVYTADAAPMPGLPAGSMAIVPAGLAGTARARDCYLVYTQSPAPNKRPTVTPGASTTADACS